MKTEPFNLSDLLSSLSKLEEEILQDRDVHCYAATAQVETATQLLPAYLGDDVGNLADLAPVVAVSERIQVLCAMFLRLRHATDEIASKIPAQVYQAMIDSDLIQHRSNLSESVPSYHMRKHFLYMLDDPYPTQSEKETLIEDTNTHLAQSPGKKEPKLLRLEQLGLWYINARRRSGWSHILSKYARNERKRMKVLIQARMLQERLPIKEALPEISTRSVVSILQENLGSDYDQSTLQDFEHAWEAMLSWIKYGVKDKVSSWIQNIVDESKTVKKKPLKPRSVTTAAKRTPVKRALTSRQAKMAAKELMTAHAIPNSDSSPSSNDGSCFSSGTFYSSSSADSLLDAPPPLMQDLSSPTLDTTRGRRVKALPSRMQGSHYDQIASGNRSQHFDAAYPSVLQPRSDEQSSKLYHSQAHPTSDSHFSFSTTPGIFQSSLSAAFC